MVPKNLASSLSLQLISFESCTGTIGLLFATLAFLLLQLANNKNVTVAIILIIVCGVVVNKNTLYTFSRYCATTHLYIRSCMKATAITSIMAYANNSTTID